jgi:23S rRNA (adenine2503-C2)-methyltransferase
MFNEIEKYFKENKIPKFRIKQLEDAVFKQSITSFEQITTYPKKLRDELSSKFSLATLSFVSIEESKDSSKFLLKTKDENFVEVVLMKHLDGRRTVCVSSQVFCPLNCKFCATGANKFERSLSCDEIVEQVLFVNKHLKDFNERATNVVFMGMGEPFLNYENVVCAIEILNNEKYLNISARHITVSTVGIIPRINDFARLGLQVRLAISLHAPNDKLRNELMPINKEYSLSKLLEATDEFSKITNKRVSFEYVLIKDVNDSVSCANELASLMKNRLSHVNLLVYNSHEFSDFEKPNKSVVLRFKKILDDNGIECSIRKSLGDDISGACGQLSGKRK